MKLTEKSNEVFAIAKDNGGRVDMEKVMEITGRTSRSVSANINDLVNKKLATREKETVEGQEKPVTYIVLTEAGMSFVPSEDAE